MGTQFLDKTGLQYFWSLLKTKFSNYLTKTDAASQYLPLSGGTITGAITTSISNPLKHTLDSSYFEIFSATAWDKGASISLNSMDCTASGKPAGSFQIKAHNGTNAKTFEGRADGTLMWGGTAISLYGHTHNYLPLTGGTMTGYINNASLLRTNTSGVTLICSGTTYDNSPSLMLRGKDATTNDKGCFSLRATDGTNTKILQGKPDGTLTWNNKNVTLEGDCLPLSGGTISGTTKFSATTNHIVKNDNTGYLALSGGASAWSTAGGNLILYGQEASTNAGGCVLRTVDSNGNMKALVLLPDGSIKWNGKKVLTEDDLAVIENGTY